jgi:hypothetical protein
MWLATIFSAFFAFDAALLILVTGPERAADRAREEQQFNDDAETGSKPADESRS